MCGQLGVQQLYRGVEPGRQHGHYFVVVSLAYRHTQAGIFSQCPYHRPQNQGGGMGIADCHAGDGSRIRLGRAGECAGGLCANQAGDGR